MTNGWERVVHDGATGDDAGWYEARREVMDHVLAAVAGSRLSKHLVLRGSATLRAWYGDHAREPGDLDFVVVPQRWRSNDVPAERMYEDVVAVAAESAAAANGVRIAARPGFGEHTYRFPYRGIPGMRVEVDWDCARRGKGTLGIDFAFGEALATPAIQTSIPRWGTPGPPIVLPTADQPLSLAWKLAWLEAETNEDSAARGKDLFDAVLLAEHCTLTPQLLRDVLFPTYHDYRAAIPNYLARLSKIVADVDWDTLAEDYPLLESAHTEFTQRLIRALTPTFHPGE